jgi:hypothetical protein
MGKWLMCFFSPRGMALQQSGSSKGYYAVMAAAMASQNHL